MTIFEIARLPAKSNSSITNPSHEEGAALQTVLDTLSKQPGFRSNLFGKDVNEDNICYIITGWQSLKDHEDFIASEGYKPFFAAAGTFLAGPPVMRHVDIPSLATLSMDDLGKASALQVKTWHFSLDIKRSKVDEALKSAGNGGSPLVGGWIEEEVNGGCGFAALTIFGNETEASKGVEVGELDALASGSEISVISFSP